MQLNQAKREGKAEEKAEMVKGLIAKGVDFEVIAAVSGLSQEELIKLAKSI